MLKASPKGRSVLLCFALLGAVGLEQFGGEVEAEAEVVDEVEDGEGQDAGVRGR
jgi:hypothetical protein